MAQNGSPPDLTTFRPPVGDFFPMHGFLLTIVSTYGIILLWLLRDYLMALYIRKS